MKEENEKNSSRDQNSRRSFIAELSMLKEMTKQQTRVSGLDINSFQIEKKDDQILQRVCCIRINRKWRIKRQIFITTTVVFLIVLGILMSFMGVFFVIKIDLFMIFLREMFIIQDITFNNKFKPM